MSSEVVSKNKKKNKKSKKSKIISFDEEVITKQKAEGILSQIKLDTEEENGTEFKSRGQKKKDKKRNANAKNEETIDQKLPRIPEEEHNIIEPINKVDDHETNEPPKKVKKRKKNQEPPQPTSEDPNEESEGQTPSAKKKTDSIREIKRKKHAKLMEESKIKTEIGLQQKSLNYLSKWKHSRSDWKFEKLRQIWLQQNMLDVDKIPDEFWETLVEYFGNSKGKARSVILADALKVIEGEGQEDLTDKVRRAREIIQNLQE